ncbi:hypothetical protein EV426DRAFT_239938 [Tirmania nivea]|nr:hypothetical protein EV426DRAFT_239938 [Tirmania nivea]
MNYPRYVLADPNPHKMGQNWARCQRMIHYEQLRYEQLRDLATRYNAQAVVTDAQSAFRAIEQVLLELFILQKKYMLHLNPSDLNLPFIRFLLRLNFSIGGKAKLYALLQELKGYNDTIARTLAFCYHPPSQRQEFETSLRTPDTSLRESHVHDASRNIAATNWRENRYSPRIFSPSSLVSHPQSLFHQPTTNTHFPSYSSQSSHQAPPTVGRPAPIPYTRTNSPTPSNATNITGGSGGEVVLSIGLYGAESHSMRGVSLLCLVQNQLFSHSVARCTF